MPVRPFSRGQNWLLPPSLDDLVPSDHPVRFVAAFVEGLDATTWAELAIVVTGEARGAPAYDARVLLGAWLYGFMSGVRSSRKLEMACRDQVPYLWLTGWQRPDHNTLWRFYQAHRDSMRGLLTRTVRTAVQADLVDVAVQAVDGTKVLGNAARDQVYDAEGLARLLARTEAAIAQLEAQNAGDGDLPPARLPAELTQAHALQTRVQDALRRVQAEDGPPHINLTDPDTVLVRTRQGVAPGYNAQAVVAPLDAPPGQPAGRLITAAAVVATADDHPQLLPMLAHAEATTERAAAVTLADGGYHSGPNLAACAARGTAVVMPEAQQQALQAPYHKDRFVYAPATDTFTCPHGQVLTFAHRKQRAARSPVRVYRATGAVCRRCPAFGRCTRDARQGRSLEIGPYDTALRTHRALMATAAARAQYRHRGPLVEGVFGILKEQLGARRFLLRGLANVQAEWALLATAFNLRTLWRRWRHRLGPGGRAMPLGATVL